MKLMLVIAIFLLSSPVIARADLVYKCSPLDARNELSADLRFAENGKSGRLDLDQWHAYPPQSLVSADFKAPAAKGGMKAFATEQDPSTGYKAELFLPEGFLALDFFAARLILTKGKQSAPYQFTCNRF